MRMVAPRIVGAEELTIAEEQEEYLPLTVGRVVTSEGWPGLVSRWRLTDEERERVAAGEDLFLVAVTFGQPMQPVMLSVGAEEMGLEVEAPND